MERKDVINVHGKGTEKGVQWPEFVQVLAQDVGLNRKRD